MPAILPAIPIDSTAKLARYFMPHQLIWIQADDYLDAQGKRSFAIAEKSVRIGWTFADAFKNVRKRLMHRRRDYLFVTKDLPSALEYMRLVTNAAAFLHYTRSIVSHGEEFVKYERPNADGKTSCTEEVKIGYVKFDNGSRIIALSSNPYAMAVYGGDVGLDEFAKHPNAKLLWETAQGRVTHGHDLAVWSAHDGEDTLFYEFVQQARAGLLSPSAAAIENRKSEIENGDNTNCPWNLYFRVTMADALELGLLDIINRNQGKSFTTGDFLADCRARAGTEEIFQQSYMCNPIGASSAAIVEWSAIERCRFDYEAKRVHLENDEIKTRFGEFNPSDEDNRTYDIEQWLDKAFNRLFCCESIRCKDVKAKGYRLGFDVAASGQGDLAAIYIDEEIGGDLWLAGLLTARTEDWHFLKTVLFRCLLQLKYARAAGDESGLGRQICWEAAARFGSRFKKVNFTTHKHDLGFALMNQLSVAQKRFPRAHQDIASDFFALRKLHNGTRWNFTEGKNYLNLASHCDIAWAGALSTYAHIQNKCGVGAAVLMDDGSVLHSHSIPVEGSSQEQWERYMLNSDMPGLWKPGWG